MTVALLLGLLSLIWGSTWLVIKEGLEDLPPFTSAGARFVIAAVVMLALAPLLRRREGGARPPLWLSATLGTLNFTVSYALVYQTELVLPSGLTSVLWAVYPLLMAGAGHWFLGETLRAMQGIGFLLGFFGIVTLFSTSLQELGPTAIPAALLLFLSPVVSAVGTTVVKRYATGCSSVLLNRDAMTIGAVLLTCAALLFEGDAPVEWTPAAIGTVTYLALMGTCLTFGLWFWLLRYARASTLSLIAYVTPCIALWLGWWLGGETLGSADLIGSALVVFGVAMAGRRRKR